MNYLSAARCSHVLYSRLLRLATSLFACLLVTSVAALAQATGRVAGSVTSTSTRNALQGATVSIPSLNRTVLTDEAGQFLIPDVPAGVVEVVVNYTGFTEGRQQVSVASGSIARADLQLKSSDLITMEKFTVESVKEGQALALTQQRNAANIKNVTALDEWGVLPTQNVGELLTRLPGLMVAQTDEDSLIMSVSIGGQPGGNAGYTRLNIDGMASTGVGGDGRTATLHSFSASMYEQVEVIAGQTPDKRADGLGGQLNLVTASPLAMSGKRRVDYTASGRWFPSWSKRNDMVADHALRPDFSLSYREVFDVAGGNRNLGIMLNSSYQEIVNPHDFDITIWQNTVNPVAWLQDYQRSSGLNDRFISAFSARVDYKVSDSTRVSFRFLYNAGSEPFFQYTHVNPFGSANLAVYDPANPASTGSILPGFTANRTEFRPTTTTSGTPGVLVGAARMRLEMNKWSFTSKNPTGTVAFDHKWGRLKVDHAYRWSHTHWDSGAGRNREGGQLQLRTKDPIGFVLDYSNPNGRVFTQTAGPSVYDSASYTPFVVTARNTSSQPIDQTSAAFIKRDTVTDTNEVSAMINASYLLPTELPITLKTGLDTVNRRVNTFVPYTRRWYGVVGSVIPINSGLVPLTEFERQHGGQRLPVFDSAAISTTLGNTALWTEDVNFTAAEKYRTSRIVEEGVDAGYIQGSTKIGRLSVLGGVRGEWVATEAFHYVTKSAVNRTPIALEPDPAKRALRDFTPASRDGDYHKFFPSLHLAYDVTSNLKLRASWSNSYGRPRLQDLVATPTADDTARRVTVGNPELKPALAKNADVRADYAFGTGGFFSVRLFRKDIRDYIGAATRSGELIPDGPDNGFGGEYVGYELVQPRNIGTTLSKGIEVDFRQQLTFLPGAFKGLAVRANYTNVRTTAVFDGISYGRGQVVGSAGQWYIPRSYNAGLTYVYRNFGANFDVNYTSQFPVVFGLTTLGTNRYRLSRSTMNAGLSYKIRPEATLFLNVSNLAEEEIEFYTSIESRHRQFNIVPRAVKFGITGRF
jgi:iron complex outermembrane recepter protein